MFLILTGIPFFAQGSSALGCIAFAPKALISIASRYVTCSSIFASLTILGFGREYPIDVCPEHHFVRLDGRRDQCRGKIRAAAPQRDHFPGIYGLSDVPGDHGDHPFFEERKYVLAESFVGLLQHGLRGSECLIRENPACPPVRYFVFRPMLESTLFITKVESLSPNERTKSKDLGLRSLKREMPKSTLSISSNLSLTQIPRFLAELWVAYRVVNHGLVVCAHLGDGLLCKLLSPPSLHGPPPSAGNLSYHPSRSTRSRAMPPKNTSSRSTRSGVSPCGRQDPELHHVF